MRSLDARLLLAGLPARMRLVAVAIAVGILLEQGTRLVTAALLTDHFVVLPGGLLALTRSDDAVAKGFFGPPSLGAYLLGLDALVVILFAVGPLRLWGRAMITAAGAVLGGSLGNMASLALAGHVSNWLAVRQGAGWVIWSAGDLLQVFGFATMAALLTFGVTIVAGGADLARMGRHRPRGRGFERSLSARDLDR